MSRDRLTQLVALLLMLVFFAAAAGVVPTISQYRRAEQISVETELGRDTPPKYILLSAALGSFRGLAANILWYRAEMLKREGEYFEANNLAQWICNLQPRYPHVWSFHAWNMAYNISVETRTPEERWDWVNRGIRLLREEGIPYNPRAIRLYRELGWIFFHKVGQYSDDMHWYYKQQMAQEWTEVLGAPTEGATRAQAVERLRPLVEAADNYLAFHRPTYQMRQLIQQLGDADTARMDEIVNWLQMNTPQLRQQLTRYLNQLDQDQPRARQLAEQLRDQLEEQIQRSRISGVDRFFADEPQARLVYDQLHDIFSQREAGASFELNRQNLRRVGRVILLLQNLHPQQVQMVISGEHEQILQALQLDKTDTRVMALIADEQIRPGLDALLAYWRARVILEDYRMDPVYMLYLTDKFGPIDWRHPAAHGVYWNSLGVERSGQLLDRTKIDQLNTDRGVIHGLQELMKRGRVMYDPMERHIDLLPDTRFIAAYELAMEEAMERYRREQARFAGQGTTETFEQGHENFLLMAMRYHYLYGDEDEARRYYRRVRQLYGDKPQNLAERRFEQPLEQLVMREVMADMDMQDIARPFVDAMIFRALQEGMANADQAVFERFINMAEQAHRYYQERKAAPAVGTQRDSRLAMLSFNQVFRETYMGIMLNPGVGMYLKSRIYRNSSLSLQQMVWPRARQALQQQLLNYHMGDTQAAMIDFQQLFPEPPGLGDLPPTQPRTQPPPADTTIERQ